MRFTIKSFLVLTLLIAGCCWFFLPFNPKIRFHGEEDALSSLRYPESTSSGIRIKLTNDGVSSIYYPGFPKNDNLVSSFDLVHDGRVIVRINPHFLKIDSYQRYVKKTELAPGESAFVKFDSVGAYDGFHIQFEVTDWRGRKAIVKSKYIENDLISPNS